MKLQGKVNASLIFNDTIPLKYLSCNLNFYISNDSIYMKDNLDKFFSIMYKFTHVKKFKIISLY